jgi:serine phosphatase RsbU (regulator of sigma subunit)
MTTTTTGIFRRVFHGLEEKVLNELHGVATKKSYPAGYLLCRQGEREHTFYIIVQGQVAATQRLDDGEERFLGIRGPNEYVGELSLLDDAPRMANVTTLVPTTVLEVTEEAFDRLVEVSPAAAYTITRTVIETLRNIDRVAIMDLEAKNKALYEAYNELQTAQAAMVEKERLERELEIAAGVQRDLLPRELPEFADVRFAAYLEPARQVGGDFYDVFALDDEQVAFVIGDVADKSIHAALIMAVSRTLFQVEGLHLHAPGAVAQAVHKGMLRVSPTADTFVTAVYGVLHRPTGHLRYVVAGHEHPLLYRPEEGVRQLPGGGRFLGMLPDLDLEEYTAELLPGDRLLLFSDGVPDAENNQGERYGYQQMQAHMTQVCHLSADALVQAIREELISWGQGVDPVDDITILVAEIVDR